MTEIITESFCERCGTRYTFEAAIPKKRRIGRLKVLSKGLKNYVLSDDSSLDEALAEARSEEQREMTGGQLDAFHQTFQFCMSCRQYTCANCWNEADGRCLSCAPLALSGSQLRSPLDDLLSGGGMSSVIAQTPVDAGVAPSSNGNGHLEPEAEAPAVPDSPAAPGADSVWPTIDLVQTAEAQAALEPATVAPAEPVSEPEAAAPGIATEDSAPTNDFWARPFTGYAPIPEPTNGHVHDAAADQVEAVAPVETRESVEGVESAEDVAPVAEPSWDSEPLARVLEPTAAAAPAVDEPLPAEDASALQPLAAVEPDEWALEYTHEVPESTSEVPGSVAESQALPPDETAAEVAEPVGPIEPAAAEFDLRAAELAERTTRLLGRFRVKSGADETAPIVAPQREWATEPAPAEPVAPVEAVEAVEASPPAEAVAPVEAVEAVVLVEAEPTPNAPAVDIVETPVWPTPAQAPWSGPPAQPEAAPTPASVRPPPVAPLAAPPIWPMQPTGQAPEWPAPLRPGVDLSVPPTWASRDAGLWNASAQEVVVAAAQSAVPGGIQSCISCGLSLSATARFCRRCGSRQG